MKNIVLTSYESHVVSHILDGNTNDPVRLIHDAGCDIRVFFEEGDWSGVDFTQSDVSDVSFKGSNLGTAIFTEQQMFSVVSSRPAKLPLKYIKTKKDEEFAGVKSTTEALHEPRTRRSKQASRKQKYKPKKSVPIKSLFPADWHIIRKQLSQSLEKGSYSSWIEPLQFRDLQDGVAVFDVPTTFLGNYVSQNFADLILHELQNHDSSVRRLKFTVAADDDTKKNSKPLENKLHQATVPSLVGAPLDGRFTFDNFVVGKSNELAFAAAKRVAEGGPITFNPLFLYGRVGLGRTHLMQAIAWELQSRYADLSVLYLSAERFMYAFIQALRDRTIMDFKEVFRSVDVLMVDDIHFIAGKDSTQEEFFHTFNVLVDQNKQIIISADRAPVEIKGMQDRIKSRMQSGLVVDLNPTDYELRLGILQSKVELQRSTFPDLKIDDGVLEFLAIRISTNVRVLEGALTRLFAYASLVGRQITMDLTQDCLADVLRTSDRKLTVEEIQRKVSEHYNIRLSDMIGPKSQRIFARPRQLAMYLCKHLTSRSLPEIGRRFGGRDHTTVMHGVRRIEELKRQDGQIADDIELLRRALEA